MVSSVDMIQTMPVEILLNERWSLINKRNRLRKFSRTSFKHVHLCNSQLNVSFRENAFNFKIFPFSRHVRGYYISRKPDKVSCPANTITWNMSHYFFTHDNFLAESIMYVKPTHLVISWIFSPNSCMFVNGSRANTYISQKLSRKWKFSLQIATQGRTRSICLLTTRRHYK